MGHTLLRIQPPVFYVLLVSIARPLRWHLKNVLQGNIKISSDKSNVRHVLVVTIVIPPLVITKSYAS
jgi:hypothetical protein